LGAAKKISNYSLEERVKAGDAKAFAQFWTQNRLYFANFANHRMFSYTSNYPVEDLLQDAYEKISKALKNGKYKEDRAALRTWMATIMSNMITDHQRKGFRRPDNLFNQDSVYIIQGGREISPFDSDLGEIPSPEELLIKKERSEKIHELVERLHPKLKMLVEMRYFQEMSYEEIIEETKLPSGTVKATLFRAREVLADLFEGKIANENHSKISEAPKEMMSFPDAVTILGCNRQTVSNYRNRGWVRSIKIGRKVYLNRADIYKLKSNPPQRGQNYNPDH